MTTITLSQPTSTEQKFEVTAALPSNGGNTNLPQGTKKISPEISNAVMQYIKAVRSLGATKINTTIIADALNLSHRQVLEAVKTLDDEGVKKL